MLARLQKKAEIQAPLAKVLRAPAEELPFSDDSFDVVVSSLVLCGVSDQQRALREIRRVLRPGGRLLFLEHVRSDDERVAHMQDRRNGLNRFVAGCDCNRPTLRSIEEAGVRGHEPRAHDAAQGAEVHAPGDHGFGHVAVRRRAARGARAVRARRRMTVRGLSGGPATASARGCRPRSRYSWSRRRAA
jgi:SAM-dependent methyltransferase